jgi:lactate dehydrogenase-like 2-hydroxyacid dehydrogenase
MKPQILVVSPMPPRVIEALKDDYDLHDYYKADDRPGLLARVGGQIRGYLSQGAVGGADAALMDATANLEIIANWAVGYDTIDVEAARARGVILTNTPDVLTECCADLGMALLLAVARRVAEGDRYVRAGAWPQKGRFGLGVKVSGRRLGIIGLGRIGKAAAWRAEAFGMPVAYHGRHAQASVPYDYYEDAVSLAANCDFLMLTCPGGPETHHIVNADVLSALGPEGFLINISRGSVVDEPALIDALSEGRIAGAALDVYEDEPRVPDALIAMENVVLQPHHGSGTTDTRRAMDDLVVENIRRHFAGEPVKTPVYALP